MQPSESRAAGFASAIRTNVNWLRSADQRLAPPRKHGRVFGIGWWGYLLLAWFLPAALIVAWLGVNLLVDACRNRRLH